MNKEQTNTEQIDIMQLLVGILKKWWLAAIGAAVGAVLAFLITYFFITPQYTSSIEMYVNNGKNASATQSITQSDITVSRNLVKTYSVILKTRQTLEDVIKKADLDYSYSQLQSMVSASAVNDTEILKVSVTCPDPNNAYKIAATIGIVLPAKISKIVEGSSVSIVDKAIAPTAPSSPNMTRNVALGFLAGAFVALVIIVLLFFFNDLIDSSDKLKALFNEEIPILAVIPDVSLDSHGKYSSKTQASASKGGKSNARK